MPRRWRRSSCAGSRSRAIRSTSRCSPRSPSVYDGAALDRREPVLDPGRGEPGALRRAEARAPRRDPGRSAAGLRHRAICAHARHAGAPRLAARGAVSARRQPDVARHRRRLRPRRRGILSRRVRRFRRLRRRRPDRERLSSRCRTGPASASRGRPRSIASCANWWRARKATRIAVATNKKDVGEASNGVLLALDRCAACWRVLVAPGPSLFPRTPPNSSFSAIRVRIRACRSWPQDSAGERAQGDGAGCARRRARAAARQRPRGPDRRAIPKRLPASPRRAGSSPTP